MVDNVIIATTPSLDDRRIIQIALNNDCDVYVGDESDVARRVIGAAKLYKVETIVRITHDCPLIDPDIIDKTIELLYSNSFDISFAGNRVDPLAYPDGLDVDVITTSFLEHIWNSKSIRKKYSPENIVEPIVDSPNLKKKYVDSPDLILKINNKKFGGVGLPQTEFGPLNMRWSLDTEKDYKWISSIYDYYRDEPFGFYDIIHDFFDWKTMITREVIDADNS